VFLEGMADPTIGVADWDSPSPGEIIAMGKDREQWASLEDRYQPFSRTLHQCFHVACENGAQSVVIETHYYDADYRSEYAAFYSRLYVPREATTHRLHFFKSDLTGRPLWDLGIGPDDSDYLGYVIVRPSPLRRVGRTVLSPPARHKDAVRTSVTDRVTLFGQELTVRGVPFMQQDANATLDRCAHIAAWMAHYSAFRRDEVARLPVAEFSLRADPSYGGRPAPSGGLTDRQLVELLRRLELPPHVVDVASLSLPGHLAKQTEQEVPAQPRPWVSSLEATCCRYLNSGYPVIVATDHHTFVLCGYFRDKDGDDESIRFVRHEDEAGPYLVVPSPYRDLGPGGESYSPWRRLIVPAPEELWLQPELAERTAMSFIKASVQAANLGKVDFGPLPSLVSSEALGIRTYARHNNSFKKGLPGRVEDAVLKAYRLARLPRYVWIVEVVDKDRRRSGHEDCVIGEYVFDATSSGLQPRPLAIHLPGDVRVYDPGDNEETTEKCSRDHYYPTGGVGPV
jgi:hypothetical protein